MSRWFAHNYVVRKHKKFAFIHPVFYHEIPNTPIYPDVNALFVRADTAYAAFGVGNNLRIVFRVAKDAQFYFGDLQTKDCAFVGSDAALQTFFTELFDFRAQEPPSFFHQYLRGLLFSHIRIRKKKPITNHVLNLLLPFLIAGESFPFVVVDNGIKLLTPENTENLIDAKTIASNIVAYTLLRHVPENLKRNKEKPYYYHKRRLDLYMESNKIYDDKIPDFNADPTLLPSSTEADPEDLRILYQNCFESQITEIPGAPEVLVTLIRTLSQERTTRAQRTAAVTAFSQEPGADATFLYYATVFPTKYHFLFAWSQYLRLWHWITLVS